MRQRTSVRFQWVGRKVGSFPHRHRTQRISSIYSGGRRRKKSKNGGPMSEGTWIRAPPATVIAVAAIVGFWLWLPSNSSTIFMKILVPLLLVWMAYTVLRYGRLRLEVEAEPPKLSAARGGDSPWGVAFFLLLLLFLISYHPSW